MEKNNKKFRSRISVLMSGLLLSTNKKTTWIHPFTTKDTKDTQWFTKRAENNQVVF